MNEFLKYTQIDDLRIGELRVFFGVQMLMGLSLKCRLKDHWSEDLGTRDVQNANEITIGYFGKKCTQTFFIPRKPSKQKNGMKLQGMADFSCGYLWSVFMQPRGFNLPANLQKLCTPQGVVVDDFVSQLKSRYGGVSGTHIYADKWYTSVGQAERLVH